MPDDTLDVQHTHMVIPVTLDFDVSEESLNEHITPMVIDHAYKDIKVRNPGLDVSYLELKGLEDQLYQDESEVAEGKPPRRYLVAHIDYAVL